MGLPAEQRERPIDLKHCCAGSRAEEGQLPHRACSDGGNEWVKAASTQLHALPHVKFGTGGGVGCRWFLLSSFPTQIFWMGDISAVQREIPLSRKEAINERRSDQKSRSLVGGQLSSVFILMRGWVKLR